MAFFVGRKRTWVNLPSKAWIGHDKRHKTDINRKPACLPVLEWGDRTLVDRFSERAIALIRRAHRGDLAPMSSDMGRRHSFRAELHTRLRLLDVIGGRVRLVRRGHEYVGLCPFHSEKTPSFYVVEDKGFFHCFGCGAHGNAIDFVTRADNLSYAEAVEKLASEAGTPGAKAPKASRASGDTWPAAAATRAGPIWIPILPVPGDAPALLRPDGRTVELINPKRAGERKERTIFRPASWWPYRDAEGRLLGDVLRMEFERDGRRKKWTPQITFCAGPGGACRWCIVPFPKPRPLYGLYELIARPQEPVIVVEGEKACDAGRRLLPGYVVVTWPGGSKGITHVDWSPLAGRGVILLPDADKPGRDAIDGWSRHGERVPGLVNLLVPIAERVRVVEPPMDLLDGWDLANAEEEGWSKDETARWLEEHLRPGAANESRPPAGDPEVRITNRLGPLGRLARRTRLKPLARAVIRAPEGQRRKILYWAACRVGEVIAAGEIGTELGVELLSQAATVAGLPEVEARWIIAGGLRRGK